MEQVMAAHNPSEPLPRIFFATRPIGPPWDEASKNLVFQIAQSLERFTAILLTYEEQEKLLSHPAALEKPIYPQNSSRDVSWRQKVAFILSLICTEATIYHFYFTPERYSSHIIRFIKNFKKGKFLQTFATPIAEESRIPGLAFGDAVVVQSDYSLHRFHRQGVRNVERIYPGIDTDTFKPGIDTTALKLKLNITDGQKVVLYAGNYYLGCNHELTEIILRLTRKDRNLKFIMACRIGVPQDINDRARLQTVLQKEGVADQVIFLQHVESMAQIHEIADINIFPARSMQGKADIPLVLLESLAMETPVIITDIPPLNEIMKDNIGLQVRPGDAVKLADAIQELLDNDSLRREMGKRGRQMVIREFSLQSYLAQYRALYQKLTEIG